MLKRVIGFILCFIMIFSSTYSIGFSESNRVNPPREALEKKIEKIARDRGIPSVLLKSIARVESVYQQYNSDGSVYTGNRGSIGLMQIHAPTSGFKVDKLKYDIDYNIEAGAEMILRKWNMANNRLPRIGDMNPNVLENWYFALWAYNGWHQSNNPNVVPYYFPDFKKKYTYQYLIYKVAEEEYGQKITPINPKLLPKSGLPEKTQHFKTPEPYHYGDITTYKNGDIVEVDVRTTLRLRESPNGKEVGRLGPGVLLEVIDGPQLKNGLFWYNVKSIQSGKKGWVARNWIIKTDANQKENINKTDNTTQNKPFNDISNSWAKKYIVQLNERGIVTGSGGRFRPNDYITREELCVLLSKALKLDLENKDYELPYSDDEQISQWAIEHVKKMSEKGYVGYCVESDLKPKSILTREQMAIIIAKIFENGNDDSIISKVEYNDSDKISKDALDAVYLSYIKGIMKGDMNGYFHPKDYLTRAQAAKLVISILDRKRFEELPW